MRNGYDETLWVEHKWLSYSYILEGTSGPPKTGGAEWQMPRSGRCLGRCGATNLRLEVGQNGGQREFLNYFLHSIFRFVSSQSNFLTKLGGYVPPASMVAPLLCLGLAQKFV